MEDKRLIREDEFQQATSPSDLKGRINLRVEAALQKELEDIAEDSEYPLRSVSEVVRFCCLDGMQRLRQWKPKPSLLGAIKAANALMARDQIQADAADLVIRLDKRVNWYLERDHIDEALELVAKMRGYFDGVDKSFWSEYILREIDAKISGWFDRIDQKKGPSKLE